jgi:DNA-directed RNA polymerase specialized sigma24 family protein
VDADRVQDAFLALRTLDANEKEVLELAFFEGLTAAEITVRTGRTPADVDKLIQSALVKVASGKQD